MTTTCKKNSNLSMCDENGRKSLTGYTVVTNNVCVENVMKETPARKNKSRISLGK